MACQATANYSAGPRRCPYRCAEGFRHRQKMSIGIFFPGGGSPGGSPAHLDWGAGADPLTLQRILNEREFWGNGQRHAVGKLVESAEKKTTPTTQVTHWVSGNNLVWISIHDLGRRANAPPLFPGCFRRPGSNMSLDTALRRGGGLRAPSGIPRGTTCESHENDLRQPGAQTGRIFFGKETKQVRDLLESKVHATTTLWITLTGCFLVLEDFC